MGSGHYHKHKNNGAEHQLLGSVMVFYLQKTFRRSSELQELYSSKARNSHMHYRRDCQN